MPSPTASVRALMSGIIDYAGLFPPAGLDMAAVVRNYTAYLGGEHAWMLGRLIVPAQRLGEFADEAGAALADSARAWRLSVLLGEDVGDDYATAAAFNRRFEGQAVIDAVEVRDDDARPRAVAEAVQAPVKAYVETPVDGDVEGRLAAIKSARLRAKIRTGGVTADALPEPEAVARFIRLCYRFDLPFKATAGLHHPLRAEHRLTYAPDAPVGIMHGFLNVFLTAAFCYNGLGAEDAPRMMRVDDAGALAVEEDAVRWGEYNLTSVELAKVRSRFAISFGSCSFEEPIADLKQLGLL